MKTPQVEALPGMTPLGIKPSKTTQEQKTRQDKEYLSGFNSGKQHFGLSKHFQAENERKCESGRREYNPRLVQLYWLGYAEGMKRVETKKTGGHTTLPFHHKPLSWTHDAGHAIFYTEEKANGIRTYRIDDKGIFTEADAAFIVKAVNNHDALVSMLQDVGSWLETHLALGHINAGTVNRDGDLVSQIREVLTNATTQR